jgi:Xaa-Pro aminopeptidase
VELSIEAHRAALREARPGAWEYALKAAMLKACLAGGASRMAYPPIIGSGPNSVILHYEQAERRMLAGEMIVNDTGCEYSMYAADLTRSYPVSGRFSPEQRTLYELVLQAQQAGFARVKPGAAFHEVYDATVQVIVDGLLRLGLLSGDREEALRTRSYTRFYPHGSSHWLGLNVHDVGAYQRRHMHDRFDRYATAQARLEPGMVFTVEPGIYVRDGATPDRRWWSIGVRIEDVVLVTPDGMECLSCALPREPAELERAMARSSGR